ncbi:sulfotransferase family 2 domain-containing protein [Microbulbifer agarilyticus]|uniref:sulfotransferase family 2 domain-containing protein n=1 Tax=Microbulbifer agarilyticus TaxID=260552 RepID=UPI001C97D4FC|nr:sulfotransferase family 2 domain-containing protein [Microbulbifer agarilyticus]MBY6212241.1 sulfotransferase family 2 domain-containing protein [Microbulbifer agarilyticus]
MRKLIVHYHLFKNAGSSIDKLLEDSFGESWKGFDRTSSASKILPACLDDFIQRNPELVAISSHQALPPLPNSQEYEIFPLLFVRHPIDRAKSAYLFEWQKQLGLDQPKGTFREYVTEKLQPGEGGAISDFHVYHLSNLAVDGQKPMHDPEPEARLQRAKEFLESLAFFGIVEQFQESLVRAHFYLKYHFPELKVVNRTLNSTQGRGRSLESKLIGIRSELGAEIYSLLEERNRLDLSFYQYACRRFSAVVPREN